MRRFRFFRVLLASITCLLAPNILQAQIQHEVFLQNTEHELNVYRIFGDAPGKTIMLIGGIQGDEPGSYLTADLYADIHLKKGNLIVVPRANFYSILLNRREGLTGDMNRKFGSEANGTKHLEEEVVNILKGLIAESDCLLNLHEGSGFYSEEWISDEENPGRFGQSIIYDAAEYLIPGENRTIYLEQLARQVIAKVNVQIENPRHQFRPNNHDTLSEKTQHSEQRLSATFYALTSAHIPAFGVETSKHITSLATKIQYHKLVINTFMEQFGIILDSPGISLAEPKLDYILVKINGGFPYALPHGSELTINQGDEIIITDIIANYERGLVADILGLGTRNDSKIDFRITDPTRIVVRKDAQLCGWVDLKPLPAAGTGPSQPLITENELLVEHLIVNVNDEIITLGEGETLKIKTGKRLILVGIRTNNARFDNKITANFKGFAPPKSVNDGDDLNYPIYTDKDLWSRYSVDKQGRLYPIVVTYKEKTIGHFWVELERN